MIDLPYCKLVSWGELDTWSNTLARKIREGSGIPDTIVALTRGGWIPSRLLADRLGVRNMMALRVQHWGVTATPTGEAKITGGLPRSLGGEKVLVVDDITDTGASLKLAVDHIQADRPKSLESATMLHITHSKYKPTYFAREVPQEEWAWFIFPWNYWEDLRTLAMKALPDGKDSLGVQRLLKELSGVAIGEADVRQAIADGHQSITSD